MGVPSRMWTVRTSGASTPLAVATRNVYVPGSERVITVSLMSFQHAGGRDGSGQDLLAVLQDREIGHIVRGPAGRGTAGAAIVVLNVDAHARPGDQDLVVLRTDKGHIVLIRSARGGPGGLLSDAPRQRRAAQRQQCRQQRRQPFPHDIVSLRQTARGVPRRHSRSRNRRSQYNIKNK